MPTPVSLSQRGFSLKPDVAANSHGVVSLLHQSQLETIDWTPLAPRAVVAPRAVGCLLVANWGSLADPSILCALSCCKFGWWPNHFLGWLGLEISGAHNLCLLGCFVGVIYGGGSGFGFEMQSRFGVLLQGWCLYFSFSDSCLLIEVLALYCSIFCDYSLWVFQFVQDLMYVQIWLLLVVVDVSCYLAGVVPVLWGLILGRVIWSCHLEVHGVGMQLLVLLLLFGVFIDVAAFWFCWCEGFQTSLTWSSH
jgi:hypothetical protein